MKTVDYGKLHLALGEALLAFPPDNEKTDLATLRLKVRVLNLRIAVSKKIQRAARTAKP